MIGDPLSCALVLLYLYLCSVLEEIFYQLVVRWGIIDRTHI